MGRSSLPGWLVPVVVLGCSGTPKVAEHPKPAAPRRVAQPVPPPAAAEPPAPPQKSSKRAKNVNHGVLLVRTKPKPKGPTQPAAVPHKACSEGPDCKRRGLCSMSGGKCVAGSTSECAQSVDCRDAGRCVAQGGACVADDAHCASSFGCRTFGSCKARGGTCQVVSDSDCQQASVCSEHRFCRAEGGRCVE